MSNINIKPEHLSNFASKMGLWASEVDMLQRKMRAATLSLGDSWKDSAYAHFLSTAEVYQKQLQTMGHSLLEAQNQLKKIAEDLRRSDEERRRRLNTLR